MKSKKNIIYGMFFLMFFIYFFVAIYQIRNVHVARVIYAAVYSNWDYSGPKLLPIPFRRWFAKAEFKSRNISDIKESSAFDLNLYSIFSVKTNYENVNDLTYQSRLEGLADIFLDKGVNLYSKNNYGCNALKLAVINKDVKAVDYLFEKGFEVVEELGALGADNPCLLPVDVLFEKYLPEYVNSSKR